MGNGKQTRKKKKKKKKKKKIRRVDELTRSRPTLRYRPTANNPILEEKGVATL